MTAIQPVQKSKPIDYGDREVKNFWLKKENAPFVPENAGFSAKIENALGEANDAIICIQAEELSTQPLVKAVSDAAERNRIYLLVNSWNDALNPLRGKCLIRYDVKNAGSFILINPNTNASSGVFFTAPFSEDALSLPSNLLLDLDADQTGVLYRHFCYHFWNTAEKEVIGNGHLDTKDSPVDIYPCADNFCDSGFVKSKLLSLREDVQVLTASVQKKDYCDFSAFKNSTVVTSISGNNNSLIPSMKEAGNAVFAVDKGISVNVIAGNDDMWILPKTFIAEDDIFFALKANENQRAEMQALMERYKAGADYEFFTAEKRKSLSGKTIRLLETGENFAITESAGKNLGDQPQKQLLPQNDFNAYEPYKSSEFPDNGKSVQVTYTWETIPFYLPAENKKHPLYQQWENESQKITGFLNTLLSRIDSAEKKESGLAKKIARFFLGKKNQFEASRREIAEDLKKAVFSRLDTPDLKKTIDRINEISRQIEGNIAEIDEENRKAKLDEEIEGLNNDIAEEKTKLQKADEELARKEKEKQDKSVAFFSSYIEQQTMVFKSQKEDEIKQLKEALEKVKAEMQGKNDALALKESNLKKLLEKEKQDFVAEELKSDNDLKPEQSVHLTANAQQESIEGNLSEGKENE